VDELAPPGMVGEMKMKKINYWICVALIFGVTITAFMIDILGISLCEILCGV